MLTAALPQTLLMMSAIVLGMLAEGGCRSDSTAANNDRKPAEYKDDHAAKLDTTASAHTRQIVSATDRQFVIQATSGYLFEVEISKVVAQKTSDLHMLSGAQALLDEYLTAGDELAGIARNIGLNVPQEMNSKHRALYDGLSVMCGKDFANKYGLIRDQSQREMIDLVSSEVNNGEDQELKAFATELLPKLQEHLKSLLEPTETMIKETTQPAG